MTNSPGSSGEGSLHTTTQPRVNVLGVGVSAINLPQAIEGVDQIIQSGQRNYVCVAAAHSIMDCRRDRTLRRIFNEAGMVTPDGMSLVWYLRRRGHRHVGRVYGPDLLSSMCQRSMERGHRICFYGGSEQTLDALKARLLGRYPSLQVAEAIAPPFRPLTAGEQAEIVERINQARPDIVWVGIGSPRQERWIAEHRDKLEAAVLIGVGAAFDFLSGNKPQAPRWIQRSGLEWLFRLASEPRRLWRRYAEYPLFLALLLAQSAGVKRYDLED